MTNATPCDRAFSSSDSSDSSSPSDLRQRLQGLPSSDEFSPLGDRAAVLSRRICRKRKLFLRLHGAADRIEESDEWEEKEERAEGSLAAVLRRMPMDARARRRARVRLESSHRDDKAMVIPRPASPFKVTDDDDEEDEGEEDEDDNNHDKLDSGGSAAARSTQECDYLRLPAIEPTLRRQPRPTSLSEPPTARFPRRVNVEARDVCKDAPHDGRSRSADLRSVSPFSFSHLLPTKRSFGGYRPAPGVVLRNLSSGSESGSAKEATSCLPFARKIADPIATLELSSPELKPAVADEPTKKMPIISAQSDIMSSVLPNLPSICQQRDDDRSSRVHRDDSRRCTTEFEDSYDDEEEEESYRARALVTPETRHDCVDDHHRYDLDYLTMRSGNFCIAVEDDPSGNVAQDDTMEKPTSAYTREADDSPRSTGRLRNEEEALSSRTSEPLGSEGHSRSSRTSKMYWQKEALSSGRWHNDTDASDKYDREDVATVTNVPTLALNSQDISCSTSAYSRECSAVQHLDPHELIEALSAVSLQRREEERDDVRKRKDHRGKEPTDTSCETPCPVAKGETWRVPRSSISESPGKALSRVPSRIPVRVPSSKTVSSNSATVLLGCRANSRSSGKIANYEEATLSGDRNDIATAGSNIVHRQPNVNSYSRIREQDSLSRENSIEVRIVETRSNAPKDDETECDMNGRASLPSSNPLSVQSAELGENIRRRAQRPSESWRSEKSRSLVFCPVDFPGDRGFLRIDEPSFDRSSEPSKVAWSEESGFQLHRTQEVSSFAARMSSLNLSGELKKKKRSQERFPFTISETPAALATKRESTIDYQVASDKDLRLEKTDDQLKENATHQLKTHPSITRLATAGLEDTVAEILYCVAQDQKRDELSSRSRIKGFMRMFSSKFRTSKQPNDVRLVKPAEVIYENRACRVDSGANSCSGHSSTEETIYGMNRGKSPNKIVHRVARSNPTLVCGRNVLRKTSSLIAIPQDHPHRRHDRDDLWVRDFKETLDVLGKDDETLREQNQVDNSKDQYSIFLADNLRSSKVSNIDCSDSPEVQQQCDALISGHVTSSTGRNKRGIDVDIVPEIDEIEEVLSGCLCLRLCRLIAPSKPRLSLRVQVPPSKTKKPGLFLWKRKKVVL